MITRNRYREIPMPTYNLQFVSRKFPKTDIDRNDSRNAYAVKTENLLFSFFFFSLHKSIIMNEYFFRRMKNTPAKRCIQKTRI